MSSLKEVARLAGISPASVSIYLNNKDTNRVSAKTKARIDQVVDELNYHKNIFASGLSRHESKLIGIILPTILPLFQNEFTNSLLSGVQKRLSSFEYSLLFFPSSEKKSIAIVKDQIEHSAGCDGYVLFNTGFCTMEQIKKNISTVSNTGKPFVTLNVPPLDLGINQIIIKDLQEAAGVSYLVEKGHKNILVLLGRESVEAAHLREDAVEILKRSGLPHGDERFLYGQYDDRTSYAVISEAVRRFPDTTAICCMSDIMAAAAIKAVLDGGFRIPEDISIMGRDNSDYSRLTTPGLTTIDIHMHQAGLSAANLLLDSMLSENTPPPQQVFIKGRLVERESVRDLNGE